MLMRRGTKNKMKTIKCKHFKGDGYIYQISKDEELCLCKQCHLNLAGEMAKQLAIGVLI